MNKTQQRLLEIIDRFADRKIAVWGDLILDEYLYGNTRRISREAPVLVLSYQDTEHYLGGAGNALLNLKALGAEPMPVGVIGRDSAGEDIRRTLEERAIDTRFLLAADSFPTPRKTRILAGEENTRKQQILRIDREGRVPGTPRLQAEIRSALQEAVDQGEALLISDYDYFNVREDLYHGILPHCRDADRPITLDSRFRLTRFPGTTVATPNQPEAEKILRIELQGDLDLIEEAGSRLLKAMGSEAVLLTLGSRGMALFHQQRKPFILPIHGTTDIVDVTGAGDTVISVFTLALTVGADLHDAARLANYAGGMVVMKRGTAVLSSAELKEAILS